MLSNVYTVVCLDVAISQILTLRVPYYNNFLNWFLLYVLIITFFFPCFCMNTYLNCFKKKSFLRTVIYFRTIIMLDKTELNWILRFDLNPPEIAWKLAESSATWSNSVSPTKFGHTFSLWKIRQRQTALLMKREKSNDPRITVVS